MDQTSDTDAQELYKEIWQDVVWLRAKWDLFCQVYAADQETIDLLNESASTFFVIAQNAILNDILMGIGRIVDPSETGKNKNLSLTRLVDCLSNVDPTFMDQIQRAYQEVELHTREIKEVRNKALAHNDLRSRLGTAVPPLSTVSRRHIDDILMAVQSLMKLVEEHLNLVPTDFSLVSLPSDGRTLVHRLREAQAHRRSLRPWERGGNEG